MYIFIIVDEQQTLNDFRREQQAEKIEKLRKEFEEEDKDAKSKEEELKGLNHKLKVLMNGINELFRLFKCKNDPLLQLLGIFI